MTFTRFVLAGLSIVSLSACGHAGTIDTHPGGAIALRGVLPYDPFEWPVIASFVDPGQETMATLFGNEVAMHAARSNDWTTYPAGSVLSLVTWRQRDDPDWFGARVPDVVQSVEFVELRAEGGNSPTTTYARFSNPSLEPSPISSGEQQARIHYLLTQRASSMP